MSTSDFVTCRSSENICLLFNGNFNRQKAIREYNILDELQKNNKSGHTIQIVSHPPVSISQREECGTDHILLHPFLSLT